LSRTSLEVGIVDWNLLCLAFYGRAVVMALTVVSYVAVCVSFHLVATGILLWFPGFDFSASEPKLTVLVKETSRRQKLWEINIKVTGMMV